jgi:mitochondrial import inner membrane translocase subunit TIM21
MSPNSVFDKSFNKIRNDPEIQRRYGSTIKAFGRDHGGHREGRRNFVEHTQYVSQDDKSNRTRVRYNIESQVPPFTGRAAFVFAEVSSQMPNGEFVYILVQDKANGSVHTVVDNRAALTAARLTSNNPEAQSAISQLLTGGGGSSGGSSSTPPPN